jgi:type I restriction enzyme, S subunit
MSFPRYANYKDSGVEWLGQVPEHWTVLAIKWLSSVQRGASPRPIDDPKYFDDEGEFAWVRIADVSASDGVLRETTQRLSELGSSLSVKISPGELFVSIAGTVGKPCLSAIRACIHDGFVYFPLLKIDPQFLYRIFEAGTCYSGLGKLGTQLNLNTDTIGSIRVALPPPQELNQILDFLDRETAKIDALVGEQRRLIELLKEKRQAVISHAVTKGLNPHAPMKPSGIEWLGEMPEHWDVTKLGYYASVENGMTPSRGDPTYWDDGDVPWLSSGEVNQYRIVESSEFITRAALAACSLRLLPIGAVIIGMIGQGKTRGLSAMLGIEATINQNMAAVITTPRLLAEYLHYVFQAVYEYLREWGRGGQQAALNCEILRAVRIPLPPTVEQIEIVDHLHSLHASFDALTAEAQRAIDLLQERRTALISAAVTGKIDVRGLAKSEEAA